MQKPWLCSQALGSTFPGAGEGTGTRTRATPSPGPTHSLISGRRSPFPCAWGRLCPSSRGEVCFGLHPKAESVSTTSASARAPQGKSWETTSTHPASLPRRGLPAPAWSPGSWFWGPRPPPGFPSLLVASCHLVLGTSLLGKLWSFPGHFGWPPCPRADQDSCLPPGSCGRNGVVNSLGAWPLNLSLRWAWGDAHLPKVNCPRSTGLLLLLFPLPSDTGDMSDWGWTGQGRGPRVTAVHTWSSS